MKVFVSFLCAFVILSISIALNNPMIREVIFFFGGFMLWMVLSYRLEKSIQVPRFVIPLAVYMLLLSGLFLLKHDKPYMFHWFGVSIIFVLCIILFSDVLKTWRLIEILENALVMLAVIACIFNLFEVFSWYQKWVNLTGQVFDLPPKGYRVSGFFLGAPNSFAGFLNIIWPIVLFRILVAKERWKKMIFGGLLLVFGVLMYFTASRSGWISALASITFIFMVSYRRQLFDLARRNTQSISNKHFWVTTLKLLPIILIVVGFLYFALFIQVRATDRNPFGLTGRTGIWSVAKDSISASPIIGNGPGVFPIAYAENMSKRVDLIGFHIDAHNMWLQIGVETGAVGILLILITLMLLIRSIFNSYHATSSHEDQKRLVIYTAIGVSVLVFNQIDFSFASNNYLLAICTLLVVAIIMTLAPDSEFLKLPRIFVFPIVVIALGIFSYLFITLNFELDSVRDGLTAAQDGNWNKAREKFCEDTEHNSNEGFYSFNCSFANTMLAYLGDDREVITGSLTAQKRGLEIDPSWGINRVNLSVLQWENGENQEAMENLKKESINFASNSHSPYPAIHLNYGWMAEKSGYDQEAIDSYNTALVLDPWLVNSAFVNKSPLFKTAIQHISQNYEDNIWQGLKYFEQGSYERALNEIDLAIEDNPSSEMAYGILALINQSMGKSNIADNNIQKALFLGTNVRTLSIAGRIARENGNFEDASDYLLRAYKRLYSDTNTRNYFYLVYRVWPYWQIFSPYMRQDLVLSEDALEGFVWLADYLNESRDMEIKNQIQNFIERSELN